MRLATGATHERDTREKAPRRPLSSSASLRKKPLARRFLSERPISATSFIRETRGRSRIHKRRGKRLVSTVDRYADFSRANNDREIAHARFCGLSCGLMRSRGWNFKPIHLSITIVQLRLLSRLSCAVPSFEYFCQPFSLYASNACTSLIFIDIFKKTLDKFLGSWSEIPRYSLLVSFSRNKLIR